MASKSSTVPAVDPNANNFILSPRAMLELDEDARRQVEHFGRIQRVEITVQQSGKQIIIPEGMTYEVAIDQLKKKMELDEKIINVNADLACFPLEGAVALGEAIAEIYGFTLVAGNPSFFGERPPVFYNVPAGFEPDGTEKFKTATLGRIQPPRFEGGYLQVHPVNGVSMRVAGEIKRKFEPEVKRILQKTQELLRLKSIYTGQAVMLDLSWLANKEEFNPTAHAPKIVNTHKIKPGELILNDRVEFELNTHVWSPIKKTKLARQLGPLKRGVMLMGPYGTGKSLTSRETALICVQNGWTFIELRDSKHFAHAYEFAKLYQPAVLFTEDIDSAVGSDDRSSEMNAILNSLDGVTSKTDEIIVVVTTNHVEKINPAFMRAGRIDHAIYMGPCDATAAAEFVRRQLGTTAAADMDWTAVGKAFAGYVTAFIGQGVRKALLAAVLNSNTDNAEVDAEGKVVTVGLVNTAHLVAAADSMRAQQALVNREKVLTVEEELAKATVKVAELTHQQLTISGQMTRDLNIGDDIKRTVVEINKKT